MLVTHWRVLVPVRVWLRHRAIVAVLVMLVMNVPMFMSHRFMNVLVLMTFGEMKPEA